MGGALIFVRHALPEAQPAVASRPWRLSESSKEDVVLLAHALPTELAPAVWASDQPMALETAAVIALRKSLRVQADSRFGDVDHPGGGWIDCDDAAATRYLTGGADPGWEPRRSVARRFEAAIADLPADSRDTVIVTFGLALTVWLAGRVPLQAADWRRALTLPDAWRFDSASGELERLFAMGAPRP